jgi:dTDP-4-amino-4,6-dideoxygalactose transaminase
LIVAEFEIPLSDLDYGPEEKAAVIRVLESQWLSMGPETKSFEEEFAAFVGTRHAKAVGSGTAALHLSFLALGLQPGDEVIQPAVNFVAAANMTHALRAVPVFGDIISLDEPNLDPGEVERLITPRSRAVVVMHYGGYPCRMAEMVALCRKHNLVLVEDACHAVGAKYHDQHGQPPHGLMAGNLADIACFSFFSNKNIAVGEGGMVTTNRDDLAEKIHHLRSHGMSSLTWERHRGYAASYDVLLNGYNYRIDDLRSALGRAQLAKLSRNNQRRRELSFRYWENLSLLEKFGWVLPYKTKTEVYESGGAAAHLLPIVAPNPELRWRCAKLMQTAGIQTSLHYPFIPHFSGFKSDNKNQELPHSLAFCANVITLPLYPNLANEQVEIVSKELIAQGCSV